MYTLLALFFGHTRVRTHQRTHTHTHPAGLATTWALHYRKEILGGSQSVSHWFLKWPLLWIICSVIVLRLYSPPALGRETLQAGYGKIAYCSLILPRIDRPKSKMTLHTDYCQASSRANATVTRSNKMFSKCSWLLSAVQLRGFDCL